MVMMSNATRIKIAALISALTLGGLTAAGLATRGGDEAPGQASATAADSAKAKPVVVHRRRVKTVVSKPHRSKTAGVPSSTPRSVGAHPDDDHDQTEEEAAERVPEHEVEVGADD